ncbi:hypothetical protein, partial [Solirhodobacter olei]|uniref:hypothetical protein n=1 Tax=Solirhodobacter olei TaxID=2493082 RepID=UPI0019D4A078
LVLISVLGSQVEGRRMRLLNTEIRRNGFTPSVQCLTRDPVAWTAKFGTLTLVAAVVLEMSLKPGVIPATCLLLVALVVAVPLGRRFAAGDVSPNGTARERATSSSAEI